jgi:thiamine-phosphate pyrophosphorylase
MNSTYRILDANLNRAAEGLRTIEDFVRFDLVDLSLLTRLKHLRHDLTTASDLLDRQLLLENRDTPGDEGTELTTGTELNRKSVERIVAAATNRTQQALRCLEEFGKLVSPDFSLQVKAIRYQAYDLFASVEQSHKPTTKSIRDCFLYVLIDCRLPLDQFIERAVNVSQAGADILQIREKNRSTAEICEYATQLKSALDPNLTTLIINDRADIAASLSLGVHLGQDDLLPFHAKKLLSKQCRLGISTHTMAQAREAVKQGADYIGCGPTFPSKTKSFEQFPGLPFLQDVASEIDCPAFAIGGISLDRLEELFTSGIGRIAVSDAIWNAECPKKAAAAFSTRLKSRAGK